MITGKVTAAGTKRKPTVTTVIETTVEAIFATTIASCMTGMRAIAIICRQDWQSGMNCLPGFSVS
jgi:hypothetical protein